MKKWHFLAQAEIVSILSSTQLNAEKLGPAQFWFSLGLSTHNRIYGFTGRHNMVQDLYCIGLEATLLWYGWWAGYPPYQTVKIWLYTAVIWLYDGHCKILSILSPSADHAMCKTDIPATKSNTFTHDPAAPPCCCLIHSPVPIALPGCLCLAPLSCKTWMGQVCCYFYHCGATFWIHIGWPGFSCQWATLPVVALGLNRPFPPWWFLPQATSLQDPKFPGHPFSGSLCGRALCLLFRSALCPCLRLPSSGVPCMACWLCACPFVAAH